jgi:DNA-binding Xre family transcriptional regulator
VGSASDFIQTGPLPQLFVKGILQPPDLTMPAELVGITPQNLSVLKTGRAKAIRFSTLERLCEVLDCQPGDLLLFEKGADVSEDTTQKSKRVPSAS